MVNILSSFASHGHLLRGRQGVGFSSFDSFVLQNFAFCSIEIYLLLRILIGVLEMYLVVLQVILFFEFGQSQHLPHYGNLHPLNFGESHCGPDVSLYYHNERINVAAEVSRFNARKRLNQHLIYRNQAFFNRKRWDTGQQNNYIYAIW